MQRLSPLTPLSSLLKTKQHPKPTTIVTQPLQPPTHRKALVAYFFGKELKDTGTGLVAAALMGVVPGYISRSVAGSFDNEAVAIFALLLTFYLFVRAVRTGSVAGAVAAAGG